mmetsp:Transcript_117603/g.333281  ORF Transcript_117603/g.333281 Transcript_117603/m.333281 type:complete len:291 (-) Transcript_117603:46-918(-)
MTELLLLDAQNPLQCFPLRAEVALGAVHLGQEREPLGRLEARAAVLLLGAPQEQLDLLRVAGALVRELLPEGLQRVDDFELLLRGPPPHDAVCVVHEQQHPEEARHGVVAGRLLPGAEHVELRHVRAAGAELHQLCQAAGLLAEQRPRTAEQRGTLLRVGLPPAMVRERHQAHGRRLGIARLLLEREQTLPYLALLLCVLQQSVDVAQGLQGLPDGAGVHLGAGLGALANVHKNLLEVYQRLAHAPGVAVRHADLGAGLEHLHDIVPVLLARRLVRVLREPDVLRGGRHQ